MVNNIAFIYSFIRRVQALLGTPVCNQRTLTILTNLRLDFGIAERLLGKFNFTLTMILVLVPVILVIKVHLIS